MHLNLATYLNEPAGQGDNGCSYLISLSRSRGKNEFRETENFTRALQ